MSTIQKQIRDAFVSLITAQVPGVNVFRAPRRDLGEADLPAICIFSHTDRPESEDDDHQQSHPRVYTLRVEIIVAGRVEEDVTDDLAVSVRKAVLSDDSLAGGGLALTRRITWSQQTWSGAEGDPAEALTGLEFNCFYLWRPE